MNLKLDEKQGNIPFIIGFTGHRDLRTEDLNSLKSSVTTVLNEIKETIPNTPIIVLSALAEGADRLCAQVAIECGASLYVPCPLPIEDYSKDFTTEQSKEEFYSLLAQADYYFEIPLDQCFNWEEKNYSTYRDYCYEQLSMYLTNTCQVLIALWDGVDNISPGGTAATVKLKLDSKSTYQSQNTILLNTQNPGQVTIINTPRDSNPNPMENPFSIRQCFSKIKESDNDSEQDFLNIIKRINMFNKDVKRYKSKLSTKIANSKEAVLPGFELHNLSHLNTMLDVYAAADQVSLYFQKLRLLFLRLLLGMGVVLVTLFLLYDELEANIMLPLYLFFFIFTFICYFVAKKREYHTKYIDYRALAEGLKVQIYWNLAGLSSNVVEHYLWSQKSELSWIRNGVSNCYLQKKN